MILIFALSAFLLVLLVIGGIGLLTAARRRRVSVRELLADWFQDATR